MPRVAGSNPAITAQMFCSSMEEQSTVNALVVGSSPTRTAQRKNDRAG